MAHSKKLSFVLYALIAFVLALLVAFIFYTGSAETANALVADTNSTMELAFPYDNSRYNLLVSNCIGNVNESDDYYSEVITTTTMTSPIGYEFRSYTSMSNSSYYPVLSFDINSYNDVTYTSCSIQDTGHYFNGSRFVRVGIPITFLRPNTTYTFSISLFDFYYNYTINPFYFNFFDGSSWIEYYYNGTDDLTLPITSPSDYFLYFNFNTGNTSYQMLYFYTRANVSFNIFCVAGSTPIFTDNYSFMELSGFLTGDKKYSYTQYVTNTTNDVLNVSGNTSLFDYERLCNIALSNTSSCIVEYDYNGTHYSYIKSLYYNSSDSTVLVSNIGYNSNGDEYTNNLIFYPNYVRFINSLGYTNYTIRLNIYQFYNYDLVKDKELYYRSGYNAGVSTGTTQGYNNGYSAGYSAGLETADTGSFLGLFVAAIESPLQAVLNMFDVEILGYNMKSLYMALITLALVLFIVRLIMTGTKGKSD